MALSPGDLVYVDRLRAAIKETRDDYPCVCGECPTNEDLDAALALDDEALLKWYEEHYG